MIRKEQFINFALDTLRYKSKEDLIENLYLEAFVDTYRRINETSLLENEIRDFFIEDFEQVNVLTKNLIQQQILILNWERWINVSSGEKSRADISLSISGFEFIIECKRLKHADIKYVNEGVKRFVELKYAEKDTCAGMVGFVIAGKIVNIIDDLKPKVRDFSFTPGAEHFLQTKCVDWRHSFQSKHKRVNGAGIRLYHLFFDFVPEAGQRVSAFDFKL
ncbi:MAG: hypothetical protein KAW12_10430 [Candidatus Aminicenantes bacterium]|nr:hypothetical protein [Candidatus Aminicenantes bacterium]